MTNLRFIHGSHHWSCYTTLGQFFPRLEKLEDKPEIKCHHHQELVERAKGSTKRIEDWESVVRSNDQEHQTDRPDELMTKSKLSALRRPEKLRSSQETSHNWIWQHTRANFSRGVLKNFKGEAAQHSNGCFDSGQREQKRKFGFCIDKCDSTLGQIFQ